MSLMRLLTMGQSLVRTREDKGRFKMTPDFHLPKFGGQAAARMAQAPAVPALSLEPAETQATAQAEAPAPVEAPPESKGILTWWRGRKNPFSKATPKASSRKLVQTELSLEKVRVVRNDLIDSDLEVVPVRKAGAGRVRSSRFEPGAKARGIIWNRFTARLFTLGHTRFG